MEEIGKENQRSSSMRRFQPTIVGFEDGGRGPQAQNYEQPQNLQKARNFSPTVFRVSPADTLILSSEIRFGLLNQRTG